MKVAAKNGDVRYWLYNNTLYHEPGREPYVLGHAQDITERKRAEDEADRLRKQNEYILNSMAEGIFGQDLEGHVVFTNPAALRMLGYQAEELVGRRMHSIIHHSHADGTAYPQESCRIYATIRDKQSVRCNDEVFWRKDGT